MFWAPKEARWPHVQNQAKFHIVGQVIDNGMVTIERENSKLKGGLPKGFKRAGLDRQRLGALISSPPSGLMTTTTKKSGEDGESAG